MASYNYEKRYVVFLDILGTKNKILNSDSPEWFIAIQSEIQSGLKYIGENNPCIETTAFSDSIIVSIIEGENAFATICGYIESAFLVCSSYNLMLRGGLAFGDLYHARNIVTGPALIEAWQLEQEANDPKCVFKQELFEKGLKELCGYKTCMYIDQFINLGNNRFMIDYLRTIVKVKKSSGNQHVSYLQSTRSMIVNGLNDYAKNPKIYKKYLWMAQYFNRCLVPTELEKQKNDISIYSEISFHIKNIDILKLD